MMQLRKMVLVSLGMIIIVSLISWFLISRQGSPTTIIVGKGTQYVIIDKEFLDAGGLIILPRGEYYAPQIYGPEGAIQWEED